MRQVIDGIEVITDRAPPVRRRVEGSEPPPIPVRFTPEPPIREVTPAIAPPMLWEEEEAPAAPAAPLVPAAEPDDEEWFGTFEADAPRAVPSRRTDGWWLGFAAGGLVLFATALAVACLT